MSKLDKQIPSTYQSFRVKLGIKESLAKTIEQYKKAGVSEQKVREILGFKEGFQMKTFKQFLIETNGDYECVECGDRANSTDEQCWCGANAWEEIDPEPSEYDGEPESSWEERTRDIEPR